jgi:hypothetical protein
MSATIRLKIWCSFDKGNVDAEVNADAEVNVDVDADVNDADVDDDVDAEVNADADVNADDTLFSKIVLTSFDTSFSLYSYGIAK